MTAYLFAYNRLVDKFNLPEGKEKDCPTVQQKGLGMTFHSRFE